MQTGSLCALLDLHDLWVDLHADTLCTRAHDVKARRAYVNGAWVQAAVHSRRRMGTTAARTDLDEAYRACVADWLVEVQERHALSTQDALGAAMGRDRSTANRYLNKKVRPEYTVLMALAGNVGEEIPQAVVTAFHKLEGRDPPPPVSKGGRRRAASETGVTTSAIRSMPIISTVAAGQLVDPTTQIEGEHQTIEIGGLPPGDYFATRVQGSSMNRISPHGSLIVVNRAERELIRGRRYIFSRRGETTYKRYEASPPRLEAETTDPESNPTIFPKSEEDWLVIGRVRLTLMDDL